MKPRLSFPIYTNESLECYSLLHISFPPSPQISLLLPKTPDGKKQTNKPGVISVISNPWICASVLSADRPSTVNSSLSYLSQSWQASTFHFNCAQRQPLDRWQLRRWHYLNLELQGRYFTWATNKSLDYKTYLCSTTWAFSNNHVGLYLVRHQYTQEPGGHLYLMLTLALLPLKSSPVATENGFVNTKFT